MNDLTAQALDIAAAGIPVFPCARDKKPITEHGFKDAKLDPTSIGDMFARDGAALIGIPTGRASGCVVIDIDPRHGGDAWLAENADALSQTRTHGTPSGGRHLVFRDPPEVEIRNSASRIAPGVDCRGCGGYVIIPPSPGYTVIHDGEPAEMPQWLIKACLKPEPSFSPPQAPASRPQDITDERIHGLTEALLGHLRSAADGTKHHTLLRIARTLGGYLHLTNWSEAEAVEQLVLALPATVEDWEAARDTALDGLRDGQKRPLTLEDRPNPRSSKRLEDDAGYIAALIQRAMATGNHGAPIPQSGNGGGGPPPPQSGGPSPQPQPAHTPRPRPTTTIIVRAGERHLAANEGLKAMRAAGAPFYRRYIDLVRVCRIEGKQADGSKTYTPASVPVALPVLSRALAQSALWRKYNSKKKLVEIDPPEPVAKQILAMIEEWSFPPLRGIIGTPTMRPDGSLLVDPGYDGQTGLFLFNPPPMPLIPDRPTKQDALEALALLNGLLEEFCFADDNNISRSAAISVLMTPVLRGVMAVAPMHVITKPEAGTGGSYLQDLASMIAVGERCSVISVSPNVEETEKRLGGAALSQRPIIALDNVSSLLWGDFLCQVTERTKMLVRRLGYSDLVPIDNFFTVFANGNQLTVVGDVVRRCIRIALDANMEDPDTREFKRNPLQEISADRGRYVAAPLIIARAYACADFPGRLPPRISYEGWSNFIRSALVWLNWPDPVLSVEKLRVDDPIRSQRTAVFTAWAKHLYLNVGYYTKELIAAAWDEDPHTGANLHEALWEAVFAVASAKSGQQVIDPTRLGHWLDKNKDTVAAGYKLLADHSDKSRPKWKLLVC